MSSQGQPIEILNNFLFPKIFQTFRMAIQPGKLSIAFFAIAVICLAGWLMDFSKTVVVTPDAQGHISELQVYLSQPERLDLHITGYKTTGLRTGVFSTMWNFAATKFQSSIDALLTLDFPAVAANVAEFIKGVGWTFKYHSIYTIVFTTIMFIVISFAGGALCRLAAIQFARGENPSIFDALRFSKKRFAGFFAAPLIPMGVIILIGLAISTLGLITNVPFVGELIMAVVSTPVALIGGAMITFILIGTIAGFNLMFPAVACDGSDFFDAISKAFIYVFVKPWRMGFYTVIAAMYGAICYTFIRLCTFLLFSATHLFLQIAIWTDSSEKETNKLLAIWPEPHFKNLLGFPATVTTNWAEYIAAVMVRLSLLVIVGLLVSFVISFYFSANTIIYALMRNRVDNTALEEIYACSQTAKPKPDNSTTKTVSA